MQHLHVIHMQHVLLSGASLLLLHVQFLLHLWSSWFFLFFFLDIFLFSTQMSWDSCLVIPGKDTVSEVTGG